MLEKAKRRDPAEHYGSLRAAVMKQYQSAKERVDYTKQKYTEEYFQKVQKECDEFENKLKQKQQSLRDERRRRLDEIKRLEIKKRERLTTPLDAVSASPQIADVPINEVNLKLDSLKEEESYHKQNEDIARENIKILKSNEKLLDQFFDEEEKRMRREKEANKETDKKQKEFDESGGDNVMDDFVGRESSINYGNIVADKTNFKSITEQVVEKQAIKIERKRTSSRNLQFTIDQLHNEDGRQQMLYSKSAGSLHPPDKSPVGNEELKELSVFLQKVANLDLIPNEIRASAKFFLNRPVSRSPSPSPTPNYDNMDENDENKDIDIDGDTKEHKHHKSSSMVIHDRFLTHGDLGNLTDALQMQSIREETDGEMEDDDLKKETDDENNEMTELGDDEDPFKLPFDGIDLEFKDLSFLQDDDLVPLSHKEMLDPDEIAKLYVKDLPPDDTIIADGNEQRKRLEAVETLEKSFMADEAIKKAKDLEKELMQKRLDEQKKKQLEAEQASAAAAAAGGGEQKQGQEIDILEQSSIIHQKKSQQEIKEELANLSPEEKARRREERKKRRNYMAQKRNRNPNLLNPLEENKVNEETVLIDREIDDWDLIPMEETEVGKELANAANELKETESKYGGNDVSSDESADEFGRDAGDVNDKRQSRIYKMNANELFNYVVSKSGLTEEKALLLSHNGLDGAAIEIAIQDNDLNDTLRSAGFEWAEVAKLTGILQFDGWKQKQSYPISMDIEQFTEWITTKIDKKVVENIINNGLDGKTIALLIEDGGNELKDTLIDCGIKDEKLIDKFRNKFVLDSHMVQCWNTNDVVSWLQSDKIKKHIPASVTDILAKNSVNGARLLTWLHPIPSPVMQQLGIDESSQGKLRGRFNSLCKHLMVMDEIEIMYWIHSVPIDKNAQIAHQLYSQKINGQMLINQINQKNLKKYLKTKLEKSMQDHIIERLIAVIKQCNDEHGGFVPSYLVQDPDIMEFNEKSTKKNAQNNAGKKKKKAKFFATEEERSEYQKDKKARKEKKLRAKQDKVHSAKRKHARVQSRIESGQSMIVFKNGKQFMKVYKGKKLIKEETKIKNFTIGAVSLAKAASDEQARIQEVRKKKYDRRRKEKLEKQKLAAKLVSDQIERGIEEANEIIGIKRDDDLDYVTDSMDSDLTDSEEQMEQKVMMTHRSTMSSSRLQYRAQFVDFGGDDDGMIDERLPMGDASRKSQSGDPNKLSVGGGGLSGYSNLAGAALENFVAGTSAAAARQLFHRRRASSIVNRIIDMSEDDIKKWDRRASHSKRLSRKSISTSLLGNMGGSDSMARHSRAFSSGHFVNKFFQNADTREILEAGMRGEAPLIVYFCEKDDVTDEVKDVYKTSALDTYIDDYATFDDYIKILSMRLEKAQKKHRTEMDELRRSKEDLTNEVDSLRTKKEELIRLIAQERSLFKRELPSLQKAKVEANEAQDQYEKAEAVIKDKFNESKLHVMMMMQFRDNHLRKLDEEKAVNAEFKRHIVEIQGEIEELLSHYFTLQNAHNKLEHSVALLSELTTLCHEVNVRKKHEYEKEIKDLLAMIERYRCRIRNVDRLINQYKEEIVELRMLHEKRSAEFKRIQKNPTTNRTAATIDYYVAQRKLYETKMEAAADTYDDFIAITEKYSKDIKTKHQAFNHYQHRSKICDEKFKQVVGLKNDIYHGCRDLCKLLTISWKQAQQDFVSQGGQRGQEFRQQMEIMNQYERDNHPAGYEFVDVPKHIIASADGDEKNKVIHTAYDNIIEPKTYQQIVKEEEYLNNRQIDRLQDDIKINEDFKKYPKTAAADKFGYDPNNDETAALPLASLHRGDPNMDTWRAPTVYNMADHPEQMMQSADKQLAQQYKKKYGYQPQEDIVSWRNASIKEDPEEKKEKELNKQNGVRPLSTTSRSTRNRKQRSKQEQKETENALQSQGRSVRFNEQEISRTDIPQTPTEYPDRPGFGDFNDSTGGTITPSVGGQFEFSHAQDQSMSMSHFKNQNSMSMSHFGKNTGF